MSKTVRWSISGSAWAARAPEEPRNACVTVLSASAILVRRSHSICVRSGFDLTVHDANSANTESLAAAGAASASSPAELAGRCDAVITCLPSPAVSERVLREILPKLPSASTWIEMSTLGRDEILRLAAMAEEHGVNTLELPVTGGVHLRRAGDRSWPAETPSSSRCTVRPSTRSVDSCSIWDRSARQP